MENDPSLSAFHTITRGGVKYETYTGERYSEVTSR